MTEYSFKYIFGPVYSWRLGISLGIDPVSQTEKTCNFDCVYCQLGVTSRQEKERKVFVPTEEIIKEVKALPKIHVDYLTITSRGEPTLAENLGEVIRALRDIRKEKIAVVTNAALIHSADVRNELALADCVMVKFDVCNDETLASVNRPAINIPLHTTISGLKDFRSMYKGKLAVQIMFIDKNKNDASKIAKILEAINPDEVQLNTPLRPSAVEPLSKKELKALGAYFQNFSTVIVYDKKQKTVTPFNEDATLMRHGDYKKK